MHSNNPVVSTAKVRGLIKKNGINYVDATGRLYPSTQDGISVWQLCDHVLFKAYGYGYNEERREQILKQFADALAAEGLTVGTFGSTFEIVKAN